MMTKEKLYDIVDANVVGDGFHAVDRINIIMNAFDKYLTNYTNEIIAKIKERLDEIKP